MAYEVIGYIGSVLLILSLSPQLIKTYKTKNANDISFRFITMQIITCLVLLTYTSLNLYIPLMIANGAILLEFIFFLILKLTYDKNKQQSVNDIENKLNKNLIETKKEIDIETDTKSEPNSPCFIHKSSEV